MKKGTNADKKIIYALILLNVGKGSHAEERQSNEEICKVLKIDMRTVDLVKNRFVEEEGYEPLLKMYSTSIILVKLVDRGMDAQMIAIVCSEPPKGFAQRTLQ